MSTLRPLTLATLGLAMALAAPAPASAQSNAPGERFTAFAVNLSGVGPSGAGTFDIVIDRWSTQAEGDRLRQVFLEKGADRLLDALQDTPRVGYLSDNKSLAWDIRFAIQFPDEDGGRRIYILTDRRIGIWEARNRPRTIDYPFTFIEMRIGRAGEGEGRASVATKITLNKKTNQIELENFGTQPVTLTKVTVRAR